MKLNIVKGAGALIVLLGFVVWLVVFTRRGAGRLLLLFGATSLGLAALTHVCRELCMFPAMGWGLPRTPGHYLFVDSTLAGLVLLSAGMFFAVRRRGAIAAPSPPV